MNFIENLYNNGDFNSFINEVNNSKISAENKIKIISGLDTEMSKIDFIKYFCDNFHLELGEIYNLYIRIHFINVHPNSDRSIKDINNIFLLVQDSNCNYHLLDSNFNILYSYPNFDSLIYLNYRYDDMIYTKPINTYNGISSILYNIQTGKVLNLPYSINKISQYYFIVEENDLYGIVNRKFENILPCSYPKIEQISPNLFKLKVDHRHFQLYNIEKNHIFELCNDINSAIIGNYLIFKDKKNNQTILYDLIKIRSYSLNGNFIASNIEVTDIFITTMKDNVYSVHSYDQSKLLKLGEFNYIPTININTRKIYFIESGKVDSIDI